MRNFLDLDSHRGPLVYCVVLFRKSLTLTFWRSYLPVNFESKAVLVKMSTATRQREYLYLQFFRSAFFFLCVRMFPVTFLSRTVLHINLSYVPCFFTSGPEEKLLLPAGKERNRTVIILDMPAYRK